MTDQASALRQIVQNLKNQRAPKEERTARVVCVTSGKGGVGKSNLTVNLALSLSRKGVRVLVIDADFGLSNVDVLLGITPQYDLSHVIRYEREIRDVLTRGPEGVFFVSGGSGVFDLLNMGGAQVDNIMANLLELEDMADVILIDTGAGISGNIMKLISASGEVIVVTTPEPTAVMDAYALVKTAQNLTKTPPHIRLVVNRADTRAEAEETMSKFIAVVRLYLKLEVERLGYMLNDSSVTNAVRLQQPFFIRFPRCTASRNIDAITWRFMDIEPQEENRGGMRSFFSSLFGR